MECDGFGHALDELSGTAFGRGDHGGGQRVIAMRSARPFSAERHITSGCYLGDAVKKRLGSVTLDATRVDELEHPTRTRLAHYASRSNGRDLGSKCHSSARQSPVVERFDAEPVSHQEQALLAGIPECESEHPYQTRQAVNAGCRPSGQENLGITVSAKAPPAQLRPKFAVVVNLTVERQDVPAIRTYEGLQATRMGIDYGESRVAEHDRVGSMDPVAIGAPVQELVHHVLDRGLVAWRCLLVLDQKSRDAAHVKLRQRSLRSGWFRPRPPPQDESLPFRRWRPG